MLVWKLVEFIENVSENGGMEQHQFKLSLTVGTKLLIGGVLLLVMVIGFLNFSAIFLLKEDKKAYVYESQARESVLAGRGFANSIRRVLDTLRLSLAAIDPAKLGSGTQETAQSLFSSEKRLLQPIAENQSDVPVISLGLFRPETGAAISAIQVFNKRAVEEAELKVPENMMGTIPAESIKEVSPELTAKGYAFLNLSKIGEAPVLGVIAADTKFRAGAQGLPVAIGFVPMQEFVKQLAGMNMTIATRSGRVLFDSDPAVFFTVSNIGGDPLFQAALGSQLSSGAVEYELANVRYLGSYLNTGLDLVVTNRMPWQKAMKATYALTEKFVLLGLMAVAVAVIFTILFSKTLTAPINRLYLATQEVAKGNFKLNLKAQSRDEIGALTSSFNVMSEQISELIQEKMRKIQIENDLAIAATVQQTLIPPAAFVGDRLRIQSLYQSADECGGDWWGFFGAGDKMAIMIADATGHGLPSALITASARSCFSVLSKFAQDDPKFSFSPKEMLAYANRVIYDASQGKIMMTFFAGTIDFSAMTLTYASAGHTPPWLFRKEGASHALKSLVSRGVRLGEVRDCDNFDEKVEPLRKNDILFLYTDGLLEGTNKEGVMYGKKRARELFERTLIGATENPLERVIEDLKKDFMLHNTGKSLDDDLTLAAMMIDPEGPGGYAKV
ncbi:MAG: hypothetical protein A2603_01145 [Bdellovibrionales bacterium RIFOXYD1_FULL_55_31]|nr:MAG: hypothetical protein A2603_01145 [Bdellovibrionales bacterium RIFOXYD1_FULL_55_31]